MNCRDSEPLLVEAARATLPRSAAPRGESGARRVSEVAAALEHAASCPSCGERLRKERELTSGLRALAAAGAGQEASSGLEAILLAAYREERGREVHTRRWIFALSGALAASLALLLGTALLLSRESGTLVSGMASRQELASAVPSEPSSVARVAVTEEEEVTDFIAYYPGADAGSLDSGALVRVRMPSSALGSFGLPAAQASQENDEEWVSAELLVAEDGSPLAIRFVRPASQPSRD
jgi:hypothetical protein